MSAAGILGQGGAAYIVPLYKEMTHPGFYTLGYTERHYGMVNRLSLGEALGCSREGTLGTSPPGIPSPVEDKGIEPLGGPQVHLWSEPPGLPEAPARRSVASPFPRIAATQFCLKNLCGHSPKRGVSDFPRGGVCRRQLDDKKTHPGDRGETPRGGVGAPLAKKAGQGYTRVSDCSSRGVHKTSPSTGPETKLRAHRRRRPRGSLEG